MDLKRYKSIHISYFCLLFICLTGAFFRLFNLGDDSLWFDETLTMIPIGKSFWAIFTERHHVQRLLVFPSYNLLLYPLVTFFGKSEFIVRLPAALFGIASIILAFVATRKTANIRSALLAAWFIAISPYWLIPVQRWSPLLGCIRELKTGWHF